MNIPKKHVAIIMLALVVFSTFMMKQCRQNSELVKELEGMYNYDKTAKFYEAENGKIVAYNQALIIENGSLESLNAELKSSIENLKIKKPSTITQIEYETKLDSIYVPYANDVNFCADTFTANFAWNDSVWISIVGSANESGVFIEQIKMHNESLIVVGTKSNGFFRRSEYIVAIENTNPYVQVTQIESYTIKPKVKFYDRTWFKVGLIGIGFVAGTLIK